MASAPSFAGQQAPVAKRPRLRGPTQQERDTHRRDRDHQFHLSKEHPSIELPLSRDVDRTVFTRNVCIGDVDPDTGCCVLTRKTGKRYMSMGWPRSGDEHSWLLYPEDALFMLEHDELLAFHGGAPVTIQQMYQLALRPPAHQGGPAAQCARKGDMRALTPLHYKVYVHLRRADYVVRRVELDAPDGVDTDSPMDEAEALDSSDKAAVSSSNAKPQNLAEDDRVASRMAILDQIPSGKDRWQLSGAVTKDTVKFVEPFIDRLAESKSYNFDVDADRLGAMRPTSVSRRHEECRSRRAAPLPECVAAARDWPDYWQRRAVYGASKRRGASSGRRPPPDDDRDCEPAELTFDVHNPQEAGRFRRTRQPDFRCIVAQDGWPSESRIHAASRFTAPDADDVFLPVKVALVTTGNVVVYDVQLA